MDLVAWSFMKIINQHDLVGKSNILWKYWEWEKRPSKVDSIKIYAENCKFLNILQNLALSLKV